MNRVFRGESRNRWGNTGRKIDWPAATQAETYFTRGPGSGGSGNPKRWMGTFVANGQGTTGMLYRRNRYFNPNGGQFTQADPLGIAGGMNAFGFARGDPVNFSDPFGLCVPWCVGAAVGAVVGAGGTLLYNYWNNKPLTDHLIRNTLVGVGVGATLGLSWQAVAAGAARTVVATEATASVTAVTSKIPFEDFPAWGRTAVGWGQDAAGAMRAMADMTAEKAATLDPAKVHPPALPKDHLTPVSTVLVSPHRDGDTLFPVNRDPLPVYVYTSIREDAFSHDEEITDGDVRIEAWCELYSRKEEAERAAADA